MRLGTRRDTVHPGFHYSWRIILTNLHFRASNEIPDLFFPNKSPPNMFTNMHLQGETRSLRGFEWYRESWRHLVCTEDNHIVRKWWTKVNHRRKEDRRGKENSFSKCVWLYHHGAEARIWVVIYFTASIVSLQVGLIFDSGSRKPCWPLSLSSKA